MRQKLTRVKDASGSAAAAHAAKRHQVAATAWPLNPSSLRKGRDIARRANGIAPICYAGIRFALGKAGRESSMPVRKSVSTVKLHA